MRYGIVLKSKVILNVDANGVLKLSESLEGLTTRDGTAKRRKSVRKLRNYLKRE